MLLNKKFWLISAVVDPGLAPALAETLNEIAIAVTIISPPRAGSSRIEWLFDAAPEMAAITTRLSVMAMVCGTTAPQLDLKEIPKLDWLKKVAEDFPPLPIGRWTIHGAQHKKAVPNRRFALQIDATNAFGTGEHPTTRGCLLMLNQLLKRRNSLRQMLDIGCGSGILAMAFTKAVHGKAVAVDLDPESVVIAKANRNANGLHNNMLVGISRGYSAHKIHVHAPYDLIMSNIFARPLAHMAKDLRNHLRPGGIAILAGLLTSQANFVLSAHRAQGLCLIKRLCIGEWSILVLQRKNRA